MSGLIWSALGQSVANAGSTIGGMMLRDIDDQRKREDEERREKRVIEAEDRREAAALKRLEEADRIKAERDAKREEELQQRVIKDTAAARTRGQEIGRAREAVAYDKLAESSALAGEQGDVPLTKEQLAAFGRKDPSIARQYRDMGLIDQNLPLNAQERRLRGAEDDLTGAMESGAHSSVIKGFQEIRKGVLDEIREENKSKADAARQEATDRRLDQIDRRIDSQNKTDQQRADAATTRANRPPAASSNGGRSDSPATTADIQRQLTVANNKVAEALGVQTRDINSKLATLRRDAGRGDAEAQRRLDTLAPLLQERDSAQNRMLAFKNPGQGDSSSTSPAPTKAPAPSNNASGPGTRNYSNLWK